ncbi:MULTISPECIES: glycosyltransferase family 1 protein [unclassified Bradyrhizobium]|uniref:glycosyltransferase family 4 protein n=1 Tax=unclassified Bradyrhizobium TaxID=2631580 RepID=UPI001FFE4EC1|nr:MULTISPECIES: glycosyltransferase family 1 protein [unclassified Bradyrhizobium]UPJ29870.1 glycosyltransferase family 4 protein [Bradyrhizobium sp. CW1]UPJ82776.1 glycosyltransferase family 4 protein [Bradyrhizobium sp. 184]UPJ90568.1 glycosyltransferase family 4 protein [Bradyrhizobium sp. 183]
MTGHGPLRVAFTHISRAQWAGGYNYQANLFAALNRYCPGEVAPVLFAGTCAEREEVETLADIPNVQVVRSAAFDGRLGLLAALTIGIDRNAADEFSRHGIDVVFESARFFGWRLSLPAVAWFPDLQHRKLPELFSAAARWRREIGFRMQIGSGRTIMLSSKSALGDFREYYAGAANEIALVRFASQPPLPLLRTNPIDVIAQYQLPSKYFYLPNQFYRHKNHQIVVDALAILAEAGPRVVVCASGSIKDSREPGYFDRVMAQVRSRGLEAQFRHLGTIPLRHVFALLRASVALINPSRFEGWSTTVEEAKSFGVPMILSDLDVHREQAEGAALFFGTEDPAVLAHHLMRVSQESNEFVVRDLIPQHEVRVAAFASDFAGMIRRAVDRG